MMFFIGLILFETLSTLPLVKPEDVVQTIYRDIGTSVKLTCPNKSSENRDTNWIIISDTKIGKPRSQKSAVVQEDGSIFLPNLTKSDSHMYKCQDAETNQSLGSVKLIVRSVPPSVNNLKIISHSV